MSIQAIGNNISILRKEKEFTQEQLAKKVGISTQAVSKWECGGTPDTELLPLIADFFNVSIDRLFGRNVNDYSDIKTETARHIASFDQQERMSVAYEYCWAVERAICGTTDLDITIEEINEKTGGKYIHSQMLYDSGITLMSLVDDMQYFMIMPEPKNGWKSGLFSIEEYSGLFSLLGNNDILQTLFLLYHRENKPFTPKLLEKSLEIQSEKAIEILESLKTYSLIRESEIELDDVIQKVYEFRPNPAFVACLAIARELIKRPNNFYCNSSSRNKPYLT